MARSTDSGARATTVAGARLRTWPLGAVCLGLIVTILASFVLRLASPPPPPLLVLRTDIPLPGALPDRYRTRTRPFAPGVAVLFDHFDFQALDPHTHRLFIAHTGPNPDREKQVNPRFNPRRDARTAGNVIVFDTQQLKVVGLLDIPHVTGLVVAPDLARVYAADAYDDIIYAIDERTFTAVPIHLQPNDSPDGMAYDASDHVVFVSNPGRPAHPDQSQVIALDNQNETVIDALTDRVTGRIPLGVDGVWGDDVGHVRVDPGLHRTFVVVQQLPNPDDPNPSVLPPPGTAHLVAIDPVTQQVVTRVTLPNGCFNAHGVAIDPGHHIAFVACVDADPPSIVRVDLRTMTVLREPPWPVQVKPDILAFDRPLQLLYVGSAVGLSLFKENGRQLQRVGSYSFGVNTHTVAVDEVTHAVYLPLPRLGNRPVLRVMRYQSPTG